MRFSYRYVVAWAALTLALALPIGVLAQSLPVLTLDASAGAFSGKWVYRSFTSSADTTASLAKLALGLNELVLTEQGGRVAGTRTGQGVSYDLTGTALYAPRQGATVRLHGTAAISGKTYNYDYFGYMIPSWGVGAEPDTIMGTVMRSDPENAANEPLIAMFSATRE